jgi:hypothetical protein
MATMTLHENFELLESLVDCAAVGGLLVSKASAIELVIDAIDAIIVSIGIELSVAVSNKPCELKCCPKSDLVVDESVTFAVSGMPVCRATVTVVTSPNPIPSHAHLGVCTIPVKYVSVQY